MRRTMFALFVVIAATLAATILTVVEVNAAEKPRPLYYLKSVEPLKDSNRNTVVLRGNDDSRVPVPNVTNDEIAAQFPNGTEEGEALSWRPGSGILNLFTPELPRIAEASARVLANTILYGEQITLPAETKAGKVSEAEFKEYLSLTLGKREPVLAMAFTGDLIKAVKSMSPVPELFVFPKLGAEGGKGLHRFLMSAEIAWIQYQYVNDGKQEACRGWIQPKAPYVVRERKHAL